MPQLRDYLFSTTLTSGAAPFDFSSDETFLFLASPIFSKFWNSKNRIFFLKPFLFKNMRFNKFSVFELMRSDWLIIEVLRPKLKFSTEVRVPKALPSRIAPFERPVVPFFRSDSKSIWTWQWMSHFIQSKVVPVQSRTSMNDFNLHVRTFPSALARSNVPSVMPWLRRHVR